MNLNKENQTNWTFNKTKKIFDLPFPHLIYKAHLTLRQHFDPCSIQVSSLLSIKTGGCSENCIYCAQSSHNKANIEKKPLMNLEDVIDKAKKAKAAGAMRFCMSASGRSPIDKEFKEILNMVREVKKIGLEACLGLGFLNDKQAKELKEAGLDYYNHNIDTSPEFYPKIVTTRTFDDRIKTIECVIDAGIKICSGGIIGLGETVDDRIKMLVFLANMPHPPNSVPINKLVKIKGTLVEREEDVDVFDFIKVIALARIMLPKSYIRLAAGRESLSESSQALCFFAGANSIFYGEKLLTTPNAKPEKDQLLFKKLGLKLYK
ncbi:MAG: biotin synthase BioB [Alphaproteobacteria bacterium]